MRIVELERRVHPSAADAVVPAASRIALVAAAQTNKLAEMEYALKAAAEQTEIDNTLLRLKTEIKVKEDQYAGETDPLALKNALGGDLDSMTDEVLGGASSPRVRGLLAPQVAANIELAQARLNSRARLLTIDNEKSSIDMAMQQLAREAALARDPVERSLAIDQFQVKIAAAEGMGLLKTTEATNYLQGFHGSIDQYDFQAKLAADPYQARDALDDPNMWPNMPDPVRRASMRAADARIDQIERRAIAAQTHADAVAAKNLKQQQADAFLEFLPQIQSGIEQPDGSRRPVTQNDVMERKRELGVEGTKAALALLRLPPAIQPNPAVAKEVNDRWNQGLDATDVINSALEQERIDVPTYNRYTAANRQALGGSRNWAIKAEGDISDALKPGPYDGFTTKARLARLERESVHSLQAFVSDAEAAGKPKTKQEIDDFTTQLIERAVDEETSVRPIRIPLGAATNPGLMLSSDPAENMAGLNQAMEELARMRREGLVGDQQYRLEVKLGEQWERHIKKQQSKPKAKPQ